MGDAVEFQRGMDVTEKQRKHTFFSLMMIRLIDDLQQRQYPV